MHTWCVWCPYQRNANNQAMPKTINWCVLSGALASPTMNNNNKIIIISQKYWKWMEKLCTHEVASISARFNWCIPFSMADPCNESTKCYRISACLPSPWCLEMNGEAYRLGYRRFRVLAGRCCDCFFFLQYKHDSKFIKEQKRAANHRDTTQHLEVDRWWSPSKPNAPSNIPWEYILCTVEKSKKKNTFSYGIFNIALFVCQFNI